MADLSTQQDLVEIIINAAENPKLGLVIGRGKTNDKDKSELNTSDEVALAYIRAPFLATGSKTDPSYINVLGVVQKIDNTVAYLNIESVSCTVDDKTYDFKNNTDEVEHLMQYLTRKGAFDGIFNQ